jgi:hypothetical protein
MKPSLGCSAAAAAAAIRRGKAERIEHAMARRREAEKPGGYDGNNRKSDNRLHDALS